MKKLLIVLLFATLSAWAQEHEPATAAHEGKEAAAGEQELSNEIWWKWATFAILAGALGWLIVKYGGPFYRSRASSIREGIEEAHKVKVEAEAKAAEIESRIADLSSAVEKLRQEAAGEP